MTSNPFRNGGADLDVMPDGRLRYISSSGFNCIRMAVDVGALMAAADDLTLERLLGELIAGVERRVRSGLKVIVDIHPLPKDAHPVHGFSDVDVIDGPDGQKFQRLVNVVSLLAMKLGSRFPPEDISLELFNEPPEVGAFSAKTTWNDQIEVYWQRIRNVLPNHLLIVAGMGYAAIDDTTSGGRGGGLLGLRPQNFDENTAFAFHPYESPLFTHQGVPGFYEHVHNLSFPADSHLGGQEKAEADFRSSVDSDTKLPWYEKRRMIASFVGSPRHAYSFGRYWREFGSQAALAGRLDVAASWADRHGIDRRRLFNTEFGVNRSQPSCGDLAPAKSVFAFVRAVRENSERAGIGVVTIHELQGSCFAISDKRAPFELDQSILRALGLK
ncbi:endoglucanase [Bradyrhizobium sp. LB1.3]